ncbi:MAG: nodulation protein NfeD, partial [Euryarchaeota archaeon]|nr:nodulation protein NfeD [Euryarchaeota archaeon]
ILGLVAIFGSIILSYATAEAGIASLSIALGATVVVVALAWRYIKHTSVWRRLVLSTSLDQESGYVAPTQRSELLGKIGKALTPLRPSGIIAIEGERVDAVTEGGFISKDMPVQVISVEGTRIVVRQVGPDELMA